MPTEKLSVRHRLKNFSTVSRRECGVYLQIDVVGNDFRAAIGANEVRNARVKAAEWQITKHRFACRPDIGNVRTIHGVIVHAWTSITSLTRDLQIRIRGNI